MLEFPGFLQASIMKHEREESANREELTVQYQLESRKDLDRYFSEFASGMREIGIKLFDNKFSAERRIFEVQAILQK